MGWGFSREFSRDVQRWGGRRRRSADLTRTSKDLITIEVDHWMPLLHCKKNSDVNSPLSEMSTLDGRNRRSVWRRRRLDEPVVDQLCDVFGKPFELLGTHASGGTLGGGAPSRRYALHVAMVLGWPWAVSVPSRHEVVWWLRRNHR